MECLEMAGSFLIGIDRYGISDSNKHKSEGAESGNSQRFFYDSVQDSARF